MIAFLKRFWPWIALALLALFFFTVYQGGKTVFGVAAKTLQIVVGALLLASIIGLGLALWWLLLPLYVFGFVVGFLPNAFYDWIPRTGTDLNANLSTDKSDQSDL